MRVSQMVRKAASDLPKIEVGNKARHKKTQNVGKVVSVDGGKISVELSGAWPGESVNVQVPEKEFFKHFNLISQR